MTGVQTCALPISPYKSIHIRFELTADETFFTGSQIHHEEAVLIGFVSITLHALPSDVFTIRRVLRIGVVTQIFFGDVVCLLRLQVVDVDIRIGRDSILQTRLFAAGVGDILRVGAP